VLAAYGERRKVAAGEVLFQEGGSWADLFVVLSGRVAIVGGTRGRMSG
jgi:CRP-like cAMP-binding protein